MIKTTTTESRFQSREAQVASTFRNSQENYTLRAQASWKRKRLLDEEDCTAEPSRTQHKAGPSKTMLTSLNTRVFNKEMQG